MQCRRSPPRRKCDHTHKRAKVNCVLGGTILKPNCHFWDKKSTAEYNPFMHHIVSNLGNVRRQFTKADMIEKTMSTFHPRNLTLQQQYRNANYAKCSELFCVPLVVEKQSDLLTKDHTISPIGTRLVREEHVVRMLITTEQAMDSPGGGISRPVVILLLPLIMVRRHLPTRVALLVQIQFMSNLVMLTQSKFLYFALG